MKCRETMAGLFLMLAAAGYADTRICVKQVQGKTSDQPPDPVVICQKLFPTAPFVRLPQDQPSTRYGVVELDISQRPGTDDYFIQNARFYDRDLNVYDLVDSAGKPIDQTSALMQKNHLPSNRVHYLVYEATGNVLAPVSAGRNRRLELTGLRPAVLVHGEAIDERFFGPWEGTVSKRRTATQWFTDPSNPANFAKIRINFAAPLVQTSGIGELKPAPILPDGKRFKAFGRFENAVKPVRLSTGECAPALTSYGAANPFPERVEISDYLIRMWRFPAMHTLWSKDFHVVFDYPKGLYASATSMAADHNFRLKDYIATSTRPKELVFRIHGNPIDQIVFTLKPVQGGGGDCPAK